MGKILIIKGADFKEVAVCKVNPVDPTYGYEITDGVWLGANQTYFNSPGFAVVVMKCKPNVTIKMVANTTALTGNWYAYLTSKPDFSVLPATPPFCSGKTQRTVIPAGAQVEETTPSDCQYLSFGLYSTDQHNHCLSQLIINGTEINLSELQVYAPQ